MDVGQELKAIAVKHAKALALELVEKVAIEALKEAAKKSATPIDDAIVAALGPQLEKALVDAINKIGV